MTNYSSCLPNTSNLYYKMITAVDLTDSIYSIISRSDPRAPMHTTVSHVVCLMGSWMPNSIHQNNLKTFHFPRCQLGHWHATSGRTQNSQIRVLHDFLSQNQFQYMQLALVFWWSLNHLIWVFDYHAYNTVHHFIWMFVFFCFFFSCIFLF